MREQEKDVRETKRKAVYQSAVQFGHHVQRSPGLCQHDFSQITSQNFKHFSKLSILFLRYLKYFFNKNQSAKSHVIPPLICRR